MGRFLTERLDISIHTINDVSISLKEYIVNLLMGQILVGYFMYRQKKQEAWIGAADVSPPKRLNFNVSPKVLNVINQAKGELDS